MNNWKIWFAFLTLVVFAALPMMSACGGDDEEEEEEPTTTGLDVVEIGDKMWTVSDNGEDINHFDAVEAVKTIDPSGFDDWRLPTIPELISLLEPEKQSKDRFINPLFDERIYWCWSCDKRSSESAWRVGFYDGCVGRSFLDRKLGVRGVPTGVLTFDQVRVPASNIVGGAEGLGMRAPLTTLMSLRPVVGARGVGLAQGATNYALEFARERRAFGGPLTDLQAIQMKFAEMAIDIEAARTLVYQGSWMIDQGR